MTSLRQIEANRRNALQSTGPTTLAGKDRSRRNAIRHGLSAETVITPVEDIEDYHAFEATVTSDYDPKTAVERELVLRLASLLWRLRRATSIETGLLQIHAERARESDRIAQLALSADDVSRDATASSPPYSEHGVAQSFLHLTNAEGTTFESLNRYETALWRQLRQTLFTLKLLALEQREGPFARPKHTWWRDGSYR
jgi:hypothetical protein